MVRVKELASRVFLSLVTIFGVASFSFALIRLTPGSPENLMRARLLQENPDMTFDQINQRVERYVSYDPEVPLHTQYLEYLSSLARGDMGFSFRYQTEVTSIIAEALPWTLFVLSIATLLTFALGIVIGGVLAYLEGTRFDYATSALSTILTSVPYYIFAILLLYVLAFQFDVFPIGGRYNDDVESVYSLAFLASALYHATLPVLSFVIAGFGTWALTMRGNAISILGEDYLRVANLRGLPGGRVAIRYVAHNAILPMYTSLLIQIGYLFGGAVILEEIFSYNGLGFYMMRAIEVNDYPLLMGVFLVITVAVVVSVLFADLTYHLVDPRADGMSDESYGQHGSLLASLKGLVASLAGVGSAGKRPSGGREVAPPVDERSSFNVTSGIEMSRGDKLRERLDSWLLTPARIIWSDNRTKLGLGIFAIYVAMGTIGVYLVEPTSLNEGDRMVGAFETWQFPLGTDGSGRDILALLVHATPDMFRMIFAGTTFATVLGTVIGTVAGYKGGLTDKLLTVFTDMAIAVPGLPLVIVLAAVIGPENPYVVGVILTINAWAGLARSLRSQVLTLRNESHVEASRIMGVKSRHIIRRGIVPNIMPYVLINFAQTARSVIFSSVGLYFLGVLPYESSNWGVMLSDAYSSSAAFYSWDSIHWILMPMLTIGLLSLSFILIAQGMDRLFNPRIRARHSKTASQPDNAATAHAD